MNHLKKVNEDHWGVVDAIKNELTSAPMDPMHGYIQGQVLQLLQENCEDLEEELETMESAEVMEERRVCQMKVCAAQADGTGGEDQIQTNCNCASPQGENGKRKWYDSMLAEYKSLTDII